MQDNLLDPANTIVIADFDGTFTKKEVMGKRASALMAILMDEKYLGQDGLKAAQATFDHYYPFEIDPNLAEEEKSSLMLEWWGESFSIIKKSGVTKEMLLEVCRSPLLQWRDQLLDFLQLLSAKKIPLIIFSAGGFGKLAIEYLLKRAGVFTENIIVFSNEVVFDEQGRFLQVIEPIIHTLNKTGDLLIKNKLLDQKPKKRHCLLIGDSLEDVRMAKGIDFDLVYKIGFSSYSPEIFTKTFDLVLPIDGSYKQIISLLD